MQALIVLDAQKGLLRMKDFDNELKNIHLLIDDFKKREQIVIATRHLLKQSDSIFDPKSKESEVDSSIAEKSMAIFEKQLPNALMSEELQDYLKENKVNHLFIVGFNAEYCCLFTAIAGTDRGYKVTYIEDASGSVNNEETYEMQGLDIVDFVGSVLDWSEMIDVLYMDEYVAQYTG